VLGSAGFSTSGAPLPQAAMAKVASTTHAETTAIPVPRSTERISISRFYLKPVFVSEAQSSSNPWPELIMNPGRV
jgi:hypothetical protein